MFVKRMEGNFHFTVKPSAGPGDAPTGAFAWPWQRPAVTLMFRSCEVAGETGLKIVFLKGMEANVRFTVKPSARLGDAPTGTSPGLGRGFYFIVHVLFQQRALSKTAMHGYKG